MRLVIAVAVLLTLAPSAAAADSPCKVPGPEARTERELQTQIRARKRYGFRSDRRYVQHLLAHHRKSHVYSIPLLPAERRYLAARERLRLGAKASAYLRRRPEISGGSEVRDAYPRPAYVAVFVADDPARHRTAIRRLAAHPQR